ncbi:asparaginase [Natrialbaceae archaeon A-CW1-1]
MSPPRIRVLSTGGTIASTADNGEKIPSESGSAIVEAAPGIDDGLSLEVTDVCQVSGFQMDASTGNELADVVERAAAEGVDGVVVTHGTDTMAETAYLLASVLQAKIPVVCTGAQRSFDQLGTDGPTNLRLAVRTAADDRFRRAGGAYVAFNDTVHAARYATKTHTSRLETFQSPGFTAVAERTPNGLRILENPSVPVPRFPGGRLDPDVRIMLVTNALGVDGWALERGLEADAIDGAVLAGTGLGNATAELGGALETALDAGVLVVLTSRCYEGTTAGVYGGPGGAATLLEAGAVRGGDLSAWKARLTLWLGRSEGLDLESVRSTFESLE